MADVVMLDEGPRDAKAKPVKKDRTGQVQSLSRALSILNTLAESDGGFSLSDLALTVGLAPSTTHRLLTTLQNERYVAFDAERRVWNVGVQAFQTGNAFLKTRDLVSLARPVMRRLMETSGETVNLGIFDHGEVIYLAQVECLKLMRAITRPGGRVPMHCSGIGKALLAWISDREVNSILHARGLQRITSTTIDTPAKLREDMEKIRVRGFSFDDEENGIGLRCVASVVFDENSMPLAGISLSGPTARLKDDSIQILGASVVEAAVRITQAMGGRIPKDHPLALN
mgnify:CR=1 FL=1